MKKAFILNCCVIIYIERELVWRLKGFCLFGIHNWYHFLSLYLSLRLCAVLAKSSASFIIFWVVSSSWERRSPLSSIIILARDTSLLAVCAAVPNSSSFADGPGMCLATVREARPLASPTFHKRIKMR